MSRPIRAALALAVLAVLHGAPAPISGPARAQEAGPVPVQVDAVRREPLAGTAPVIGRLVARESGVVSTRTEGPVAEVRVQVGDHVDAGEILAVLVTDRLVAERDLAAAELAEQKAARETAEAALALARQELDRLEALRQSAAFSQARYDDKVQEVTRLESEVAEAKAVVARAEANLRLAQIDLYNAEIRAPYAGAVTLRHTSPGAVLGAGAAVVTMVNDAALEIEADVPSPRLAGLSPGATVAVEIPGGETAEAAVRAIVPDENPRTRTRPVRFTPRFDAVEAGLAANQTVVVEIPVAEARDVLSVHKDAVISRGERDMVFVVKGEVAEARQIILGEAVGSRFEVLDGLRAGELVVVRGNERLRPGQKVRYEESS